MIRHLPSTTFLALGLSLAGCASTPRPSAPAAAAVAPQIAPAPGSLLPGGAAQWQLVWQDEFDYPDAKLDERWISQNAPSTHILSSRWRENAVVADGTLRLVNRKEERGGQHWTSGNIWSKEQFTYGYFECRYRYAAAPGTNNSFWLMTNKPGQPTAGKRFEIDINEGHYPNTVNTNIHNWSDIKKLPNGKTTHPSASKTFAFGVRPDVSLQLETPVHTRRLRLTSTHRGHFHIGEFRAYNVNAGGYPAALSATADKDKPGLVNFARDPRTTIEVSGFYKDGTDTRARLVDGQPSTTWISQDVGDKSIEFTFPEERVIGCVQFLNGWSENGNWKAMIENYRLEYEANGKWVPMSVFDSASGQYNFARDFQTYGLEWTPKEIVFYFNGRELRRERNDIAHSPSPIWLSLAIIPWGGAITDAINGTQMEVDYVRVYQRR